MKPHLFLFLAFFLYWNNSIMTMDIACAICLDTQSGELKKLECNEQQPHTFHAKCIDAWTAINYRCPLCKQPLYSELQEKLNTYINQRNPEAIEILLKTVPKNDEKCTQIIENAVEDTFNLMMHPRIFTCEMLKIIPKGLVSLTLIGCGLLSYSHPDKEQYFHDVQALSMLCGGGYLLGNSLKNFSDYALPPELDTAMSLLQGHLQ